MAVITKKVVFIGYIKDMAVKLICMESLLGAEYFAYIISFNDELYLIQRYHYHSKDELTGARRD